MADRVHVPAVPADHDRRHEITFTLGARTLASASEAGFRIAEAFFADAGRVPRLVRTSTTLAADGGILILDAEGRPQRWTVELTFEGELRPRDPR